MRYPQFAAVVRQRRRKRRLTQWQLAEISGISLRAIQQYEAGEVLPRPRNLLMLAAALGGDSALIRSGYSGFQPGPAGPVTPADPEPAAHSGDALT